MKTFGFLLLLAGLAGASEEQEAVSLLIQALQDPDRGVRYAAVQALGKAKAGLNQVVLLLEDDEWVVRQEAGRALRGYGPAAVQPLALVLATGSPEARVEAVEALGWIGKEGVPWVIIALDDPDERVVLEALDGLYRAREGWEKFPVPRLVELLCDKDKEIKLAAALLIKEHVPDHEPLARKAATDVYTLNPDNRQKEWADYILGNEGKTEPEPRWAIQDLTVFQEVHRSYALRMLREAGPAKRDAAPQLREIMKSDEPIFVRAAARGLEFIGEDPRPLLLEPPVNAEALLFVHPCSEEHIPVLVNALEGAPIEDQRALLISLGRIGSKTAIHWIQRYLKSPDARVRGAAVWALGKCGRQVIEAFTDGNPVVRELAAATVTDETELAALLETNWIEARRLAARRLRELGGRPPPELERALTHPDPVLRVEAARALAPRELDDKERDVRIAAGGRLDDLDPRVRTAALRKATTGADRAVRFLKADDPYISREAFRALMRMGKEAALPVARLLGSSHCGVLHYAPKIFEKLGTNGAPAVDTLVALLKHRDTNVREIAARCLGYIGDPRASAALVEALSERRLPVIANAALALGKIGVTRSLLDGMRSDHVRVRAYSAFALGWALGEQTSVDQVDFGPRLPVYDCGETSTVAVEDLDGIDKRPPVERFALLREGLKSSDPRVSVTCAVRLDFDHMDAWEMERCIELLIPFGFRPGNPIDFDFLRSYIGPNELPALLQYTVLPRQTQPSDDYLYGHLHRTPRSDNIPALHWFYRNEDWIRTREMGSLGQPEWHSARFKKERLPDGIWASIESDRMLWAPDRWWIEDEEIPPEKVELLIDIALKNEDESGWPAAHLYAALRALSRVHDVESELLLRRIAERGGYEEKFALAALARRGDPEALARLAQAAMSNDEELRFLVEYHPGLAAVLLRRHLPDARVAYEVHRAIFEAYHFGTRWHFDDFLGIEPGLHLEEADATSILATAVWVPGCRTRRLARAAFDKIPRDAVPESWLEEFENELDPFTAFLWSANPRRTRELLRAWAKSQDGPSRVFACKRLFLLGDRESLSLVAEWLKAGGAEDLPWLEIPEIWRNSGVENLLGEDWRSWGSPMPRYDSEELDRLTPRQIIEDHPETYWDNYDYKRADWIWSALEQRWANRGVAPTPYVLMQRALWPNADARSELWSIYRAGRYRWVVYRGDEYDLTLGRDLSTIPHWIEAMESNCCALSGRVESAFEKLFDIHVLYGCASSGIGKPPSDRVYQWFDLYGGDLVFCPLVNRFVARPN